MAEIARIGEIIATKKLGNPKKKLRMELIKANWSFLVGEEAREHSSPTKLSRGTLTVAADSAAWANELCMKTEQITKGIEGMLGKNVILKVRVQARQWAGRPKEQIRNMSTASGIEEELDVEVGGTIGKELENLEDLKLREALTRMVNASRSSKRIKQGGE